MIEWRSYDKINVKSLRNHPKYPEFSNTPDQLGPVTHRIREGQFFLFLNCSWVVQPEAKGRRAKGQHRGNYSKKNQVSLKSQLRYRGWILVLHLRAGRPPETAPGRWGPYTRSQYHAQLHRRFKAVYRIAQNQQRRNHQHRLKGYPEP